jgi:CBS domain-containing protein/cation transport regulator ChaB
LWKLGLLNLHKALVQKGWDEEQTRAIGVGTSEAKMIAREVMTTNMVVCKQDATIEEVARLMAETNCGAVPVIEDDESRKVVGIITDRDIVCRALAKGLDPEQTTVAEAMTTHVYIANEKDAIEKCLELMEQHHVRRIPVVDKGRYCSGIVTLTNIAESLPERRVGKAVKEIEKTNLEHLVPGKEPENNSERFIYGGIRPEFTAPSNMPMDVPMFLPPEQSTLYYDAYNAALPEVMRLEGMTEEEIRRECENRAWEAVKNKYRREGDKWVPRNA